MTKALAIYRLKQRVIALENAIEEIPVMDRRKYISRAAWPMMDKIEAAKLLLKETREE